MLEQPKAILPNNSNGYRTTHTCELCGFEPKTKNKYREKQDHMVMKHFKEKIDKLFPTVRPYTCPAEGCEFLGKDKQALLRHYTGKHGILEKFLREALSEKGIHYIPGELSKRKSTASTSEPVSNNNPKPSKIIKVMNFGTSPTIKSNNEELRREVEAMMASFQPQPLQGTQIVVLPQSTQLLPVPYDPVDTHHQGIAISSSPVNPSLKVKLPQQPLSVGYPILGQNSGPSISVFRSILPGQNLSGSQTVILTSNATTNTVNSTPVIVTSSGLTIPQTISTSAASNGSVFTSSVPHMIFPNLPTEPLPFEYMNGAQVSTNPQSSSKTSFPPGSTFITGTFTNGKFVPISTNGGDKSFQVQNTVILSNLNLSNFTNQEDNEVVMCDSPEVIEESKLSWDNETEASVIIDGETFPIKFIDSGENGNATHLDSIDYEALMSDGAITTSVDGIQERQLDFYML